ncbi:hypothetical protein MY11210_009200 [Beauveria gryllotalpidicola]
MVLSFDGETLLMLQFRAAKVADIKGLMDDNGAIVWDTLAYWSA